MTLILLLALTFPPPPEATEEVHGTLVRAVDGDTVDISTPGRNLRVRLAEIDAPEKGQPFHTEARHQLHFMCWAKLRVVVTKRSDKWGRVVGHIYAKSGDKEKWVNLEMVKQGNAWWANDYSTDHRLATAQAVAWEERKGLWKAEDRPTPPWRYRKRE